VIDLKAAGIRFLPNALGAGQDAIQFAITTWDARSHPNYPAEFDVFFDIDRDGSVDYVVFNAENGGLAATGQNVTALCRLNAPGGCASQVVRFFTAADLNSANAIFTILRSDVLGLTAATQFDATFCAGDNYYTGLFTDCIGPTTYTLNAPRFSASDVAVPAFGASNLGILRNAAGGAASPSQTGILLMYRDARTGREADAITVVP
jgi:hypothetical protein